MTFTINDKPHQIALKLDNRSASKKLYITCPYCQEQRQHLYVIKTAYVCRKCIGLHYVSQSERPQERLIRRIRKLRKDLWGHGHDYPEINNMFENVQYWPKPKGMRWKTFEQKRNKLTELENRYWPMSLAQMKTMFGE
jgi:DNA-directed RNA polymerase subunit RPC12/RpoP